MLVTLEVASVLRLETFLELPKRVNSDPTVNLSQGPKGNLLEYNMYWRKRC